MGDEAEREGGAVPASLTALAELPSAGSVDEAITVMEALTDLFDPRDGFAYFNRMYLLVTQSVQAALTADLFRHSEFLTRLDVEFANHYLRAVALASTQPEAMPRCWRVLHQHRRSTHVAPLQFAVAGMNAHINHDLVLSLVSTWRQLGEDPHRCHSDFSHVNAVLAGLENGIRRSFESGLLLRADNVVGAAHHHVDMWSIRAARAAAWHDAHSLWRIRTDTTRARYQRWLDEAVAAAGECLLLPADVHRARRDAASSDCCAPTSFLPDPRRPEGPCANGAELEL